MKLTNPNAILVMCGFDRRGGYVFVVIAIINTEALEDRGRQGRRLDREVTGSNKNEETQRREGEQDRSGDATVRLQFI